MLLFILFLIDVVIEMTTDACSALWKRIKRNKHETDLRNLP